jgi:histidine ammonia-lyase
MITLDGASLTIDDVVAVAEGGERVGIAIEALKRMQRSRDRVEGAMRGTKPVYALNTGVGLLANIRLEDHEIEVMQVNLIRSHCCGVGAPLPVKVVRGMMLIRANVLAKGLSGIRAVVAERICDLLNCGITPVVPSRGSVGASGDLAPLAHMALALIGEGQAEYQGECWIRRNLHGACGTGAAEARGQRGHFAAEWDAGDAVDWLSAAEGVGRTFLCGANHGGSEYRGVARYACGV